MQGIYPYKKNINISIINTGIRNRSDQVIYPKKDGMRIPFSSAIDFTMKFGALPIYVLAPINTAPQEIAIQHNLRYDTNTRLQTCSCPQRSCSGKKYQICRCIIQKTGHGTGYPEHLPRFGQTKLCTFCFQNQKCRDHRNKNTNKQHCHFLNSTPGKMVVLSYTFICCLERKKGCCQNNHNLYDSRIGKFYFSEYVDSTVQILL